MAKSEDPSSKLTGQRAFLARITGAGAAIALAAAAAKAPVLDDVTVHRVEVSAADRFVHAFAGAAEKFNRMPIGAHRLKGGL